MKPRDLMLRGLAQRNGDVWVAICLEFDLAAQGDTLEEAKERLIAQTVSYLKDALLGQDRQHAHYLLHRRAPWHIFAKWYFCRAISKIDHVWRGAKAFCTAMPMQPGIPVSA